MSVYIYREEDWWLGFMFVYVFFVGKGEKSRHEVCIKCFPIIYFRLPKENQLVNDI